ncbi:MAG TPA: chromate resistance protein ChrB domain-containing protein [Verrucomicrobiae bacterium]|nr:chromate resistance protein ChrB domain-containing protein [Verrucomicrobiae bacterium]
MKTGSWVLLLYGLPTKRNAERVSLWRKLKKFGAIQLKSSAYVLPDNPVNYERFQWLSKQIQDGGGEATLIRVAQIEGMPDERIVQMFIEARTVEYKELVAAGRQMLARSKKQKPQSLAGELKKVQRRFDEIREVDYFKSPSAHDAQMMLQQAGKLLAPKNAAGVLPKLDATKFKGKTWLTRPRPGIDRAGSAWLIQTFIDPKARFVFGTQPSKHPDALPFDMLDAEFSHQGDDCTFETLVKRFGITDPAVLQMAEMIHDVDLEDGKFRRCECIGINSVLSGWAKTAISDAGLLAKGVECFDGLYRELTK